MIEWDPGISAWPFLSNVHKLNTDAHAASGRSLVTLGDSGGTLQSSHAPLSCLGCNFLPWNPGLPEALYPTEQLVLHKFGLCEAAATCSQFFLNNNAYIYHQGQKLTDDYVLLSYVQSSLIAADVLGDSSVCQCFIRDDASGCFKAKMAVKEGTVLSIAVSAFSSVSVLCGHHSRIQVMALVWNANSAASAENFYETSRHALELHFSASASNVTLLETYEHGAGWTVLYGLLGSAQRTHVPSLSPFTIQIRITSPARAAYGSYCLDHHMASLVSWGLFIPWDPGGTLQASSGPLIFSDWCFVIWNPGLIYPRQSREQLVLHKVTSFPTRLHDPGILLRHFVCTLQLLTNAWMCIYVPVVRCCFAHVCASNFYVEKLRELRALLQMFTADKTKLIQTKESRLQFCASEQRYGVHLLMFAAARGCAIQVLVQISEVKIGGLENEILLLDQGLLNSLMIYHGRTFHLPCVANASRLCSRAFTSFIWLCLFDKQSHGEMTIAVPTTAAAMQLLPFLQAVNGCAELLPGYAWEQLLPCTMSLFIVASTLNCLIMRRSHGMSLLPIFIRKNRHSQLDSHLGLEVLLCRANLEQFPALIDRIEPRKGRAANGMWSSWSGICAVNCFCVQRLHAQEKNSRVSRMFHMLLQSLHLLAATPVDGTQLQTPHTARWTWDPGGSSITRLEGKPVFKAARMSYPEYLSYTQLASGPSLKSWDPHGSHKRQAGRTIYAVRRAPRKASNIM